MARQPRRDTVLPDHPHHIIVRGNNRRNLFSYVSCYRAFLSYVAEASQRLEVPVHALTLMRNHAHIVSTPHEPDQLAAWVKRFAQRYAARRNRARDASGKLFEQRYTAIPIRSEAQLAATIPYIELNPVRAGLVAAPDAWRWSTYALHAGRGEVLPELAALWTPHAWWSSLGATTRARGRAYGELVHARLEEARARDAAIATESSPYTLRLERPDRSRAADGAIVEVYESVPDANCAPSRQIALNSTGWDPVE